MSYEIVLRARARRAIDRAADWYHKKNEQAATSFLHEVGRSLQRIGENPNLYPIVRADLRRAVVPGFPYSLLYSIRKTKVVVTNCVHSSRDPRHWR
ncbi:type II toxin-antitoxin system RelE/ParE family toxin [Longimicrobium sp.]|uniref:type II toxin-antitoxin system RelE/ParE family toxin n=1 Tax=Longimicrobium sp. TaxID=2029185 RepID=UPI002E30B1DA|nr:type II toxin-antitoxin system RelE/ParE family toxin [Longimicrobium sp.]HEX6039285.1 type II toxin-antitoxin system RelE/ParE family toxin [Longimicrobium sp.]